MLIINGAGSKLAGRLIESNPDEEIIAISRGSYSLHRNVETVHMDSCLQLPELLTKYDSDQLTWVNFQTYKADDILININYEHLQKSFMVNFYTNFFAAKSLMPKMIRRRYGRFIFIDSSQAMKGDVGCFAYSVSKAANRTLMQSITLEYARFGITCNTISLGFASTPMFNGIAPSKRESLLATVPGKKIVDLSEVSLAVDFLRRSASVTGQVLGIDGGLMNRGF